MFNKPYGIQNNLTSADKWIKNILIYIDYKNGDCSRAAFGSLMISTMDSRYPLSLVKIDPLTSFIALVLV